MRKLLTIAVLALPFVTPGQAKPLGDPDGGYSFEVPETWVRMDKGEQFFIRPVEQVHIVESKIPAESQARESLKELDRLLSLVSARVTLGYEQKGSPVGVEGSEWKGLLTPFTDKSGRAVFQLVLRASGAKRRYYAFYLKAAPGADESDVESWKKILLSLKVPEGA